MLQLEAGFKETVHVQSSVDSLAEGNCCTGAKTIQSKPNFAKAARQLVLKWSSGTNSPRSCKTWLLSPNICTVAYDEYVFFLIRYQVSVETGETHTAVIHINSKCWRDRKSSDIAEVSDC